ncbi:MAG: YceI family protein [Weeksellaceae bacterium]
MKKVLLSLSAIALITMTSCEKKEAVAVTDSQEVAVAGEESANYVVDTSVSNVEWRGYKIYEGETEEQGHYGTINLKSGEVQVENSKIVSGSFVIDATTIQAMDLVDSPEDKSKLEGHLKSPDFLDVEKFHSPTFNITSVNPIEGEYNTEISGNLKMREVEKNITFKANVGVEGDVMTISSEEFTINRQDFGITFVGGGGAVIKDNVSLRVNVTAKEGVATTVDETVTTEETVETEAAQ